MLYLIFCRIDKNDFSKIYKSTIHILIMTDKKFQALEKLGLTTNETIVYTTLVRVGSVNVASLAKYAGLYRPYVYDTLDRLQEKGLVSSIISNGKQIFQATHPSLLLEIQEEQSTLLKKTIKELEILKSLQKESAQATLYSGRSSIRIVQQDVIQTLAKEGGENLVIGVDEKKFMEVDEIAMYQFFNQMIKHKFKERIIVREGDSYLPAKRASTTYRYLPKQYFEPTATFIYGSKVAIIMFSQPLHAIILESKELSVAYRKQFELLWKIAKH